MTLEQRKKAFTALGKYIAGFNPELKALVESAHHSNAWFTARETERALTGISLMISEKDLEVWLNTVQETVQPRIVGLVLAGNIPMVGFHDILSVLASGHIALIKTSSQDKYLIPHLLRKLIEFEPAFESRIRYAERLEGFEAVIATGSNNTSRYFEHYFSKVPHIIRKNRNSIGVLTGEETESDLKKLGHDIFDYFGLGCRNVSKLFVPKGYDFSRFFEAIESFGNIINHYKYCNNYDYNKSIYLINRDKHLDNGFLLVKNDQRLASPLAVLYFEEYERLKDVDTALQNITDSIQCIVSNEPFNVHNQQVEFGQSQQPKLWDYADGVNTLEFLGSL